MENNNSQQSRFQKTWHGVHKNQHGAKPPHGSTNTSAPAGGYFQDAEAPKNAAQEGEQAEPKIKSFKDLIVWQKGFVLVKEIYAATATFPREELYGLVSQLRRSAVSVPSNIAEGFRRRFQKELKQFLNIALGSLAEIETQLAIASALGYLKAETTDRLNDLTDQVIRLAIGLSKKV